MTKSQIESLKAITPSMMIPNQDVFKDYIDKIEKILNSINLNDAKNRSTKKAIEAIIVALKNLVMLSPSNAAQMQQQLSRILIKLLSPTIEGDLRQTVWANTVELISFCNLVIPFQQLDSVVETAFFFKQLHSVSDQKTATSMEDCIRDQCAQICNNSNIYLDHQRFEYWVNIIFQFILPIFWQNFKLIDVKRLRESVIDYFLSFLSHNLAIPGSASTLSKKFNPFVNYYTMQLLFSALDIMSTSSELNDHYNLVINFIRMTFNTKIRQVFRYSKEQPIDLSVERTILFYLNEKLPLQYISTFFEATLTPESVSLVQELSESPNLCPQIFEIISRISYKITECINYSISQKPEVKKLYIDFAIHILKMEGLFKGFIQIVPSNKLGDVLFKYIFGIRPPPTASNSNFNRNLYQHLFQMLCIVFQYGEKGIDLQSLTKYNMKFSNFAKQCELFTKVASNVIHHFSKLLASVFCQNLLKLKYASQNNELLFINPVFFIIKKYNIGSCIHIYLNAQKWPPERVQQFAIDFVSTFGTNFQFYGMISFTESLVDIIKDLKALRPNFDFVDKQLIPLMMDYFAKAPNQSLLKLLNDIVNNRLNKKVIDQTMAIRWTYILLDTIKVKSPKISTMALCYAMKIASSQFVLAFAFIESINNNFSYEIYDNFAPVVLKYLGCTAYASQFYDCPSSTQLFYLLLQNPKFVLNEQYIQTFFLIFLEEVAIDTIPFTAESKKIFQYMFEQLSQDNGLKKQLLVFVSAIPLYASKIQKKDPDLLLQIVPELQSCIMNSQDAETAQYLMKLMGNLLITINHDEPLFHPCFKFMLTSFNQRDDHIRNESFNFFLSNYRRNYEKPFIPKTADCVILDSSENMTMLDFKSQTVLISNKYNADQYHVDFVPIAQPEANKNDMSIGYFLPHSPLSLFFDAILSPKKDKQYLMTTQQNIHLAFNLANRNFRESYLVSVLYINHTRKTIEECVEFKIQETSPVFEKFLTSIGQSVNVHQTDFRYNEIMQKEQTALYFENFRYQVMFMVGPLMNSPKLEYFNRTDIIILWMDGAAVTFSEAKLTSKIIILIRPLSKGLVNVIIKSKLDKDAFLFLPLCPSVRSFIVPQNSLGFLIQITIMLAESQINGQKHSMDSDAYKSMLKLCSSQSPMFR